MSDDMNTPDMPEGMVYVDLDGDAWGPGVSWYGSRLYTADQMRAYAKQAAEAERVACAATIRSLFANRVGTAEWAGYAEAFIRMADEAIRSRGTK